ncbi:hypothetical protein VV02_24165 [Luteipulveratus mongoliensis]|uniref:Uncharacterized protein n=1 Tax=Luteipulveratus mongoliensis TaxID=571913 RepID=A0A0K1JNR3_9MICO|nr:hypothetical protein VV02_24165 [Luteipulveratus mongoliensis]
MAQRERDQQDPVFLDWLSAMDDELKVFFNEDVPDMPADPWTEEGLRHAEHAALAYYWADDPMDLDWPERSTRFARYLGEVFVRSFEGTWKWIDVNRNGTKEPVVRRPATDVYFEVDRQVGAAMSARTGDKWAWLFEQSREHYERWVAAGRLSPDDWFEYELKHPH